MNSLPFQTTQPSVRAMFTTQDFYFDENHNVRRILWAGYLAFTCYLFGVIFFLVGDLVGDYSAKLVDVDLHGAQTILNLCATLLVFVATISLGLWGLNYVALADSKLHKRFWARHDSRARSYVKSQFLGLAFIVAAYILMEVLLSRLPSST